MTDFGRTYADLEMSSSEVSWRGIRSLRAAPPGIAGGERKETFGTALEQAEQLFGAAERAGVAARPIALFYGLSQAGRALAAVRASGEWKLRGHGLSQASSGEGSLVADFAIKPTGGGAFGVVAGLLGSSGLPGATRLGDLWPLIPETARFPLPDAGPHVLLNVFVHPDGALPQRLSGELSNLPADLGVPRDLAEPTGPRSDWDEERDRVAEFLESYPSLQGYEFNIGAGQPIAFDPYGDGSASVPVHWPVADDDTQTSGSLARRVAVVYGGHSNAYPCIDGTGSPLHPVIVWWALLFGMSVLARYEPEAWGRAIDVDSSPEATAIEYLLDRAFDALPELIHRTLLDNV